MPEEEPSLNIPSLLTLAVVSFFVIRWFFKRDGSPDAGGPRTRGRGNIVDPAQVEQIAQMFPQLSSREIIWDLQRNGGNVAATTERILSGRGLDMVRTGDSPIWLSPAECRRYGAGSFQSFLKRLKLMRSFV
jgi:coupling of ubiquitin conjugation to ER degradation protein 1